MCEEMADQWRGDAMGELEFFIAGRMEEEEGFDALKLTPAEPAGACRATPEARPGLPFVRLQTALRLRPRRALSSAEVKALCASATPPLK